jgi:hypothetical protein
VTIFSHLVLFVFAALLSLSYDDYQKAKGRDQDCKPLVETHNTSSDDSFVFVFPVDITI